MSAHWSTSNNVPILTETNYPIWKIRIRAKLQREKVWGTISGDDPDPSTLAMSKAPAAFAPAAPSTSATAPSSTISFPPITSSASSLGDTWQVRNDKALGIIIEYIGNEKLDIIADETMAKAAWEKLEKVQNVALIISLTFTDMLTRKYTEGSSMEDHIALFAADNYKLAAMGEPLGDGMKAFMLLDSLPTTSIWEVFTTSYLQSLPAGQLPTFEATSVQLLTWTAYMKCGEKTADPTSAPVSNARPRNREAKSFTATTTKATHMPQRTSGS